MWELKNNGIEPTLTRKIMDRAMSYKNGSKTCNLRLTGKYPIITSNLTFIE